MGDLGNRGEEEVSHFAKPFPFGIKIACDSWLPDGHGGLIDLDENFSSFTTNSGRQSLRTLD